MLRCQQVPAPITSSCILLARSAEQEEATTLRLSDCQQHLLVSWSVNRAAALLQCPKGRQRSSCPDVPSEHKLTRGMCQGLHVASHRLGTRRKRLQWGQESCKRQQGRLEGQCPLGVSACCNTRRCKPAQMLTSQQQVGVCAWEALSFMPPMQCRALGTSKHAWTRTCAHTVQA